ncbi:arsenate reductase/protein-tyrosine-phosphatase family protein [Subtercola sp. YIM 133946]|uniref:arsenate reductase/protein-tyrosine-phosphatase family protein n=1 Tax=Subtercola sp. YIM 133946 TaxID=3118909 RepID=UPI002F923FBC
MSVLFVCSGNICRSPLAELWLSANVGATSGIAAASAGVVAAEGDPVTEQLAQIARSIGLDPSHHRSRYLSESIVAESDLLIAMTRSHRRAIVEMVPRKIGSTFTLREFAHLASEVTDAEIILLAETSLDDKRALNAVLKVISSRRGQSAVLRNASDDDVVDPYKRDDETYQLSKTQMLPALSELQRVLTLISDTVAVNKR